MKGQILCHLVELFLLVRMRNCRGFHSVARLIETLRAGAARVSYGETDGNPVDPGYANISIIEL